jgi:hypothetical protein
MPPVTYSTNVRPFQVARQHQSGRAPPDSRRRSGIGPERGTAQRADGRPLPLVKVATGTVASFRPGLEASDASARIGRPLSASWPERTAR